MLRKLWLLTHLKFGICYLDTNVSEKKSWLCDLIENIHATVSRDDFAPRFLLDSSD